jgi:hypothetical protein
MSKHFVADDYTSGVVTGFYDDEHETILGSVPITDAEWEAALQAQSIGKILSVVNSVIVPSDPVVTATDAAFAKHSEITTVYEIELSNGLVSNALGSDHLYPIDQKSKLHLIGAVIGGVNQTFPCYDASSVLSHRVHTPVQLVQLLQEGSDKIQALEVAADDLRNQVNVAFDADDVAAINAIAVDFSNL